MSRTASWLRTAAMALAILCLSVPVMAQTSTTGIIEGRVTNAQGGPIADAVITAAAGRAPVSATTDAQGRFFLVNLPPGMYTVRAEAQNFGTVVQEDIQVNVGTRSRVDFQLNPGQVEEVVVRGEAPVIDPKS
ncbi:MAG TPA: carboxypeptidase-like regulatory domain-containing protein, partial [Candidatus Polarisedimenticolaceae bacterium]|nr:carboxypeptidase-like regulatory domain-containing protein [Candidatus Polarisedimenticolaceae bacterium]